MATAIARTADCRVCQSVRERSQTYGHFLVQETYNDGATLGRIAPALGFCSPHARNLVEADPPAAMFVARWLLQLISRELGREEHGRNGYQDALRSSAPCPWCASELQALELALSRVTEDEPLCPGHGHNLQEWHRTGATYSRSPQPPCASFAMSAVDVGVVRAWWSPAVAALWGDLEHGCAVCAASHRAGEKRMTLLGAGPAANETWDAPLLCVAHDEELGCPRSPAFSHETLKEGDTCSVCLVERRSQSRAVALAVVAFGDPAFREAYADVEGFCLPHLRHILETCPDRATKDAVVTLVRARVDAYVWELDEQGDLAAWALRDQRTLDDSLAPRAWQFIAGNVLRPFGIGHA